MAFMAKDLKKKDITWHCFPILVWVPWQFEVETHRVTTGGNAFLDQYLCIRCYKNVL